MRLKSKKGHLVEIRILGSEECETETFEKAKQIIQEEKSLSYCDGSWYERFWPLLGLVPNFPQLKETITIDCDRVETISVHHVWGGVRGATQPCDVNEDKPDKEFDVKKASGIISLSAV